MLKVNNLEWIPIKEFYTEEELEFSDNNYYILCDTLGGRKVGFFCRGRHINKNDDLLYVVVDSPNGIIEATKIGVIAITFIAHPTTQKGGEG